MKHEKSARALSVRSDQNAVASAIRWGKPIPWDRAARAGMLESVTKQVIDQTGAFHSSARSTFIEGSPLVARRLLKIATGKIKKATVADEIAAGKLILAYSGIASGPEGSNIRRALTECTLDELESVLNHTAELVRNAKAIESSGIVVPVTGTEGKDAPDPSSPGEPAAPAEQLDQADPAGGG